MSNILYQRESKVYLFIFLPLNIKLSLCYHFTQIYFIKVFNEKVFFNTILISQIQKYLFFTFNISKFIKFCIQLNINPMKSTMVSKWNLNKIWIYFLVFLSKKFNVLFHYNLRKFNYIFYNVFTHSIGPCIYYWLICPIHGQF
jgi:hypothetical protein